MQTLASVTEPKVGSDSGGVLVAETPLWRVSTRSSRCRPAITLSPFRTTNPDVLRRGTAETT